MKEETKKVVFIDSDINMGYLNKIMTSKQRIGGVWKISKDRMISSIKKPSDALEHATLCAKVFLDHVSSDVELFFINIWDEDEPKANINALLLALSWCLDQGISVINLSIGTTFISDAPKLFDITHKLITKGTIIVAATSNDDKLTFPAAFDHVISVKAIESEVKEKGWIYYEDNIDRIDVNCYTIDETIEHKDLYCSLYCANSLANPIISAKICDLLSEGYDTLAKIRNKLKEMSKAKNLGCHKKKYQKYFEEEINIPIIAITNENVNKEGINRLVKQLLSKFTEYNYEGICLSEQAKTDLSEKIINIVDVALYNPAEKLRFYTHYCNVDYILIEASGSFLFENLASKDLDLVVYQSECDRKTEKSIQCVEYSEYDDFNVFFDKVYGYLSEG